MVEGLERCTYSRYSQIQILAVTLANGQLVCLRLVGFLNPVKFDLVYWFQAFARPN